MLHWEVLDKRPLPDEPEPRGRGRWALVGWLALGALLLLMGVAGGWRVRDNEARLRQDIVQMVALEEEVRRVGISAQASLLMDPEAPQSWQFWYESFLREPPTGVPQVVAVEPGIGSAVATLRTEQDGQAWQSERAYRLVEGEWRRSPMPATRWGEPRTYHSPHFTLHLSERDAAILPPDEFLAFLETFREGFLARWPAASAAPLTLHIEPHDLEPLRVGDSPPLAPLHLNSPLLFHQSTGGTLLPLDAYRLAVADAIAASLDVSAEDALSSAMLRADYAEASLYTALRHATVRALVLTETQQQAYREALRAKATPQSGLDQATLTFLADYLTLIEGEDAPGRLAVAYRQSVKLEAATIQAFGIALSELVDETRLWLEAEPQQPETGSRRRATVLRVLEGEPLRIVALAEGEIVTLHAYSAQPLPVADTCLVSGSEISFLLSSTSTPDLRVSKLSVERLRLPAWPLHPLPPSTIALVSQPLGTSTRLLAVTQASEEVLDLLTLSSETPLTIHPGGQGFAFLSTDRCGTSVNRYHAATHHFSRIAVRVRGEGYLLWSDDRLLLLDDRSQQLGDPQWSLTRLDEWAMREQVTIPVMQGQNWGRYLGYQDGQEPWHLLEAADGQRYRVNPTNGVVAPLLPTDLPLPDRVGKVAHRPGWLAYTLPDAPDGPELYLLDMARARRYLLHRAPMGAHITSLALGRGVPPAVVAAVQSSGEEGYLKRYTFPPPPDTLPLGDTLALPGIIENLHWCAEGQLFYRLTHDGSPRLAEGFRYLPSFLPTDGQIVACIGSSGSAPPPSE